MPLRNRVDPFGEIHENSSRGLFMGNRGVIHDAETRTLLVRRWTTQAWIICRCDFPGRKRQVMGRNTMSGRAGWTELFFLDEVTALSAGHRPCFFCRRERASEFLRHFAAACCTPSPKVAELDRRLHGERRAAGNGLPALSADAMASLPDGAVVAAGSFAWAKLGEVFRRWQFQGYGQAVPASALPGNACLITPPTTVAILGLGYRPVWHGSALG